MAQSESKDRDQSTRDAPRERHGFQVNRRLHRSLPFLRPFVSKTPIAITAMWVGVATFVAAGLWFLISVIGYILVLKFNKPIPDDQYWNVKAIFSNDAIPLNRFAVNVITSFVFCVGQMFQLLFLVGYRWDRRSKTALIQARLSGRVDSGTARDMDFDMEQRGGRIGRRGHGDPSHARPREVRNSLDHP